jgi:hypothetical protein
MNIIRKIKLNKISYNKEIDELCKFLTTSIDNSKIYRYINEGLNEYIVYINDDNILLSYDKTKKILFISYFFTLNIIKKYQFENDDLKLFLKYMLKKLEFNELTLINEEEMKKMKKTFNI